MRIRKSQNHGIAVCRYNIRTNSGKATSIGAKGGVYTSEESFADLTKLPQDATFTADVEFTQYQDENKVTGHVKFNFARIS